MAKKDEKSPETTSMAYDAMMPRWQLMDALLGGTETMRAAGQTYLPKHPAEELDDYRRRLNATVLLNMTEFTVGNLSARPFNEPIKLGDDVPDEIKKLLENVDLQGSNLDVFCRNWFRDGMAKAFSHVLVEFPRVQQPQTGQVRTLADDKAEGLRPYWVHICPENLIFASAEYINGKEKLVHVRIKECVVERQGFAETVKERIRVLEPGLVQVWELTVVARKRQWKMVEEYSTDLDYIPLVTFYSSREGLMIGKPPLTDLAHLNVTHWQSSSDQRNVLTVSRFPMLAVSGGSEEDNKIKVGPNQFLYCPDPQGKFYYVEPTGSAIEAGRKDLEDLEAKMASYGAEFLRKKPGTQTATARALDSAESISELKAMTIVFKDAVELALSYTADWLGMGADKGGTIELADDREPQVAEQYELDALKDARQRRDISREAYLEELRRRGILDEDYDAELDAQKISDEGFMAGSTGDNLDPLNPALGLQGGQ